jgi:hypothetical protein
MNWNNLGIVQVFQLLLQATAKENNRSGSKTSISHTMSYLENQEYILCFIMHLSVSTDNKREMVILSNKLITAPQGIKFQV